MSEKWKDPEARRSNGLKFLIMVLAAGSAAGVTACAVLLFRAPTASRAAALAMALALASYFVTAFFANLQKRLMMLKIFFALIVGIYAAEAFLFAQAGRSEFSRAAKRLGLPFDNRERPEVLKDLRRAGPATTSYVPDQMVASLGADAKGSFPLSGISNITTVFCNELGRYLIYRSDEHGFNNPPGLHVPGEIDMVTIGDSFVLGGCVQPEQNITSQLRARGFRDVSLGVAGSGPLIDLALLQEYAAPLKPRQVLWFYTEGNDREDFASEMQSKLLTSYFDRRFSQNLPLRQPEIDALIRSLEAQDAAKAKTAEKAARLPGLLDLLTIRDLRYMVTTAVNKPPAPDLPAVTAANPADSMLERTFREAKERVESWGGRLWVVYLPDQRRYALGDPSPGDLFQRDSTLRLLAQEQISVIDFKTKLDAMDDPLRFYAFRRHAHYTPEGYAMLADLIAAHLRPVK